MDNQTPGLIHQIVAGLTGFSKDPLSLHPTATPLDHTPCLPPASRAPTSVDFHLTQYNSAVLLKEKKKKNPQHEHHLFSHVR